VDSLDALSDLYELEQWSTNYSKYGPYAQPPHMRWYIANYQVSQGISWEGTDSEYESYAAACIHVMGACGHQGDVPGIIVEDPNLLNLPQTRRWTQGNGWKRLMFLFGKGQQLLHYASKEVAGKGFSRKSRWDPEAMADVRTEIVTTLFSMIPSEHRLMGITDAIDIITGRL